MQSTDSELVLLFFDHCLNCKCYCALLHVNKYVKHVLEAGGHRIVIVILLVTQNINRHCRKLKPVIRLILQAGSGM